MGIVTGQGLAGLVRERYGIRAGVAAVGALLVANVGTTCAEFAGRGRRDGAGRGQPLRQRPGRRRRP